MMLSIKNILSHSFILFAGVVVLVKGILPGWNNTASDFNNYYVSAKLVTEGKPIHRFYDNAWFHNEAKKMGIENGAKFSPFPPLTTVLYLPLNFWNYMTAKRIWLVLNVLLLFWIPFRARKLINHNLLKSAALIALFMIPIASNLNFGQVYLVIAWLLLETILWVRASDHPFWAGFIVGILASIKYLPLLFLGYFFTAKRSSMRAVLGVSVSLILGILIFFMIDPLIFKSFTGVFTDHLQGDLSGQGKFAVGFQSLDSLLHNLFLKNPETGNLLFVESPYWIPLLKIGVWLLIGGACIWILKKDAFKFNPLNTSICIFGAFVLIPASASYHFLLLLVPTVFIMDWLNRELSQKINISFILLLILALTIQHHHIPTFKINPTVNLILHYPRFWSLLFVFSFLVYVRIKEDRTLS